MLLESIRSTARLLRVNVACKDIMLLLICDVCCVIGCCEEEKISLFQNVGEENAKEPRTLRHESSPGVLCGPLVNFLERVKNKKSPP